MADTSPDLDASIGGFDYMLHGDILSVMNRDVILGVLDLKYPIHARFQLPKALPPATLAPSRMAWVRQSLDRGIRVLQLEDHGRATVVIVSVTRHTTVTIVGRDHDVVGALWQEIHSRAAPMLHRPDAFDCSFWTGGLHGPVARDHDVPALKWADIRRNYPATTASQLGWLMPQKSEVADEGRLLLWHGSAGTGKTSAATCLAYEWRSWCDPHVITDPERFFLDPNYLMTVAQGSGRTDWLGPMPTMFENDRKRWKLIICEDADEYLRSDARQRSGPALGRLLNLTDGLMGQGSQTIVLLTTNDELGRLHPAVTRPGRCLATIEFPLFSAAEADAWCPDGVEPPGRETSLAELYARLSGNATELEPVNLGLYL